MRVLEQKENHIVRLVRRFQEGDTSAYAEIYRQTYPQIYYYVYRMLRDLHEAQDITQEVFVNIYQNLPKLENPRTFRRWANRAAVNACIDHVRDKRGQQTESIDALLPTGVGMEDLRDIGTEKEILSAERSACVLRALDELSPQLRATVLMRYYLGYKEREIAEEMRVPLNTVKRRMMLAKKRLSGSLTGIYSFIPFFCLKGAFRTEYHLIMPLNEAVSGTSGMTAGRNIPAGDHAPAGNRQKTAAKGKGPAAAVPAASVTVTAAAAAAVIMTSVRAGQPQAFTPSPDTEPPRITGYRETEDGMEVLLSDDGSGISWEQTWVTERAAGSAKDMPEGQDKQVGKAVPEETAGPEGQEEESRGRIIIPFKDFPATLEAWDNAGNYGIYRISLVTGGDGAAEIRER